MSPKQPRISDLDASPQAPSLPDEFDLLSNEEIAEITEEAIPIYDRIISSVFTDLIAQYGVIDRIPFSKALVENKAKALFDAKEVEKHIKNIADIKYTYDARKPFPKAIAEHGHWAIVGTRKGHYEFVKMPHDNLIYLPATLNTDNIQLNEVVVHDLTPKLVTSVLGDNEQATMARVRHCEIIRDFAGMLHAHQVQGHDRTFVRVGQIEVDEVYVGHDHGGRACVIPVSAKGGSDKLSYSQALNLYLYAADNGVQRHKNPRKTRYRGLKPIPVGAVREKNGAVVLVEFSTSVDVRELRIVKATRYVFVQD